MPGSTAAPLPDAVAVRRCGSQELAPADLAGLLDLFGACWPEGGFTADDVAHAMGGVHWIAEADGVIVGHASVVPRILEADGVPLATGYVEAVATLPAWRWRGIARHLMTLAGLYVAELFELGALSTGDPAVYAGLGWERWRGPTWVRTADGPVRTEEEDDGVMILRTRRTPAIALTGSLSCDWRPGDSW